MWLSVKGGCLENVLLEVKVAAHGGGGCRSTAMVVLRFWEVW